MSEQALKPLPCPFCGCENVRVFQIFERQGYAVDCNRCNGGFHNVVREDGISRWNTRPTRTATEDEVTPAMIEAGHEAYTAWQQSLNPRRSLGEAIYLAMRQAARRAAMSPDVTEGK